MAIKAQALARHYSLAKKSGPRAVKNFYANVRDALENKAILAHEIGVRDLFESFVKDGREMVQSWTGGVNGGADVQVLEGAGVVDTGAFSVLNQQLYMTSVLDAWESPELMWRDLVTVKSTKYNGERLGGIAVPSDEIDFVGEGDAYGSTGLNEIWVDTPTIPKMGTIIRITKEAILHDQTGQLLDRAQRIAEAMAWRLEKRVLDCVFGIVNNYKRNGIAGNTYLASGDYVNISSSNPLTDYRSIDTAQQLFESMVDPDTGEPIVVNATDIIVPKGLQMTANRIVTATGVSQGSGSQFLADMLKNPDVVTHSGNPIRSPFTIRSNQYVKLRSGSASTWFMGNPKRAFYLMENWPIQVVPSPANSHWDFERDVVAQYKVSHKAVPVPVEPRYMLKCTA